MASSKKKAPKKTTKKKAAKRVVRQTKPIDEVLDARETKAPAEQVNNVSYYNGTAAAEYIEKLGIHVNGYLTMIVLYLYRLGKKPGQSIESDLRKAEWYLHRLVKIEGVAMLKNEVFVDCCNALEALMQKHGVTPKEPEPSSRYQPEPDENGAPG